MKTANRKMKNMPKLRVLRGKAKGDKKPLSVKKAQTLSLIRHSGELSPLQQEALIIKYRIKARKLGRSILRRWHSRMDVDEIDSIVDLSLCEAVKRFDPFKGASFMTFLFYHLKGNLVRAVSAAAATTSLPALLADFNGVFAEDGDSGDTFHTANAMEIADAVTSQDTPLPDEALWRKELTSRSSDACEKLDALEREIIKRIFVQEQQIIDIAAALGYSRCHISRVKKKALDTLHDELQVVMNHDDYAALAEKADDSKNEILDRIANRKEIHRRRPRGPISKDAEVPSHIKAA